MPIQILPARLANQIAAGEVVERPASVVKELVENSLDSGANSIEIDIEKGGHKRILIRDNGSGIVHEELALALSRHATSKITKLDDLEAICSLGFRGEALASISSVSRLSLSSKPADQSQAWQAHCEGRDMQVQLNPVAHPDGTSVDVVDLFFNTPARRKFLRTEKTEFAHIDEVVRRIALSRFDVSFKLKHNGKLLRKYPAVKTPELQLKRIAAICGKDFAEQCIELNSQYQQFELHGWLAEPKHAKAHSEFQYFYVNGRMMRDKLINHAVRQAFEGLIAADLAPTYVLYLTLEPSQVDVNVHPAKHEVRFHQARLVHDFIYRALTDSLNQYFQQGQQQENQEVTILPQAEPKHDYILPLQNHPSKPKVDEQASGYSESNVKPASYSNSVVNKAKSDYLVNSSAVVSQATKNYQQLMTVSDSGQSNNDSASTGQWLQVAANKILVNIVQNFFLIELNVLRQSVMSKRYANAMPVSQPLLMPISIASTTKMQAQAKALYQPLLDNSVEIGWTPNRIILRKVPAGLRQLCWIECLEEILNCEETETLAVREHLLTCIASTGDVDSSQTQELWQQFISSTTNLQEEIVKIGKPVELQKWLATYE